MRGSAAQAPCPRPAHQGGGRSERINKDKQQKKGWALSAEKSRRDPAALEELKERCNKNWYRYCIGIYITNWQYMIMYVCHVLQTKDIIGSVSRIQAIILIKDAPGSGRSKTDDSKGHEIWRRWYTQVEHVLHHASGVTDHASCVVYQVVMYYVQVRISYARIRVCLCIAVASYIPQKGKLYDVVEREACTLHLYRCQSFIDGQTDRHW